MKRVVVLDYGSGNIHSAVRMLERVGAAVELTANPHLVAAADGLYVPGVGNFHACMAGLDRVGGRRLIGERIAAGAPVLGVCVGMQIFFSGSTEPSASPVHGLERWAGMVERLHAPVVPHMGWSRVEPAEASSLFGGVEHERFYFVHSYAAPARLGNGRAATFATHGARFVAAIEDGVLAATQFHPEKSGDAGAHLLTNWLRSL